MVAQRTELARLGLPPVVDDYLVHDAEQVGRHRADRAVGHDKRPGRTRPGCSSGSGAVSRVASTRMSAPSKVSSNEEVTRTGVLVSARSRSAKASRDSGRRLGTRISAKSKSSSSMVTLEKAVPRAPAW